MVTGRVQGVGFRNFVFARATELELAGWVRNEGNGDVHVYAIVHGEVLDRLAGHLRLGPRMAEVRGVEQYEVPVQQLNSFRVQ